MKFLKTLALIMALTMLLAFGVACDSGDDPEESTTESTGGESSSTEPFVVSLKLTVPDENGDALVLIDENEVTYNGLKATNALTIADIVADYCEDNDLEYTLSDTTGRLESVSGHTVAEGGYQWKYKVNGTSLSEFDNAIANGSEIVITLETVG